MFKGLELIIIYWSLKWIKLKRLNKENGASDYADLTCLFHVSGSSVLPTKVHQRVIRLVNVHLSLPFIWVNHLAFHRHFSSTKFYQILALRATSGVTKESSHFVRRCSVSVTMYLLTIPHTNIKMLPTSTHDLLLLLLLLLLLWATAVIAFSWVHSSSALSLNGYVHHLSFFSSFFLDHYQCSGRAV